MTKPSHRLRATAAIFGLKKKLFAHIWDDGKQQLKDPEFLGWRQWLGGLLVLLASSEACRPIGNRIVSTWPTSHAR